jgi:hypothetical protein
VALRARDLSFRLSASIDGLMMYAAQLVHDFLAYACFVVLAIVHSRASLLCSLLRICLGSLHQSRQVRVYKLEQIPVSFRCGTTNGCVSRVRSLPRSLHLFLLLTMSAPVGRGHMGLDGVILRSMDRAYIYLCSTADSMYTIRVHKYGGPICFHE